MKLLAIAILCLSAVSAEEKRNSSSSIDQLDVSEAGKNDGETKSSEAQRKRDSGYSYTRPDRFSSSQRHESSGNRGRIVTKYPSSDTVRPFNRYGPPKQSGSQFAKPSGQYAPQHRYTGPHNRRPQQSGFDGQSQMQQEVPSPIRNYDFVEPSPIASQNNEPFNSNAASYLPPRNQKLPGYASSQAFSNQHATTQIPEDHRVQIASNQEEQQLQQQQQQQQQSYNDNFQPQNLVQGQFHDQQQISDAALFLAENAQAISQLYDRPAASSNYEPIQNFQGSTDQSQHPNNQFQTFDVNAAVGEGGQSSGLEDTRGFQGPLPSYASGILDPQQTLRQIQSLEKDRLISQLQRDLVTARVKAEGPSSTSARYAQNHPTGSYVPSRTLLASLGTEINPSIGPQLDKPGGFNGQRPFGSGSTAFGGAQFPPGTGASTQGFPFAYGLRSTTPTTATATSATTSSTAQRPLQGATNDGSSPVGTSVSPPGTPATNPFLHYGGFVPTIIGTDIVANYPSYGTDFLGSAPSSVDPVRSPGSSPTHFGIPIPTIPAGSQGTTGASPPSGPPKAPTPQAPSGQHHRHLHHPSTPVNAIPIQPVQPIRPIGATPVHSIFPIGPSVTQVHPVQAPVPVTSGQPTYGVVDPLLLKPVKAVYPVYYYQNVYQIQKPALPTYPWNYAPSYAQTKPAQIWK